ncbi:insulin receptor substrate 2 isoform X2 [Neocloeon triangulifer]|uniref:insulin receptor substrate 2 isoform X2 n=1 Tax=Neocloeon triangulifer TaxID=2078957 RepID=UPI00286EF311|nr:insulin receptor substrate 2 isoform X2 [Neocloeon triangulifer]
MAARVEDNGQSTADDIARCGNLKKLKTMKKKYFVLRRESAKLPARLEYYDSEKKFSAGVPPKRSITLKKCFNINKRLDTRVKHCLALYTKDDSFCIVLDSAEQADDWLNKLLELQNGGSTVPGVAPKPTFEFVWEVKMQEKGLGASYEILGPYRVCLTARSLSLLKMNCKDEADIERNFYDFPLASIRRCGASERFFYMEVGRSSITGAGELWMVTEDNHIAQHMHSAIIGAMSKNIKSNLGATPPSADSELDSLGPKPRNRSSSATESSKPILMQQRRQTHANGSETSGSRERCDSLPCAPRTRTTSEGYVPASSAPHHHPRLLGHMSGQRPASMYAKPSPPIDCSPVSPTSAGCSTDSAGSSLSIDEIDGSIPWSSDHQRPHGRNSLSDSAGGFTPPSSRYSALDNGRYKSLLSPDESMACPIAEESLTDYMPWSPHEEDLQEYVPMERQTRLNLPLVSSINNNNNNNNNNNKYDTSKTAGSPSEGCYMDMSINSPSSSSPLETTGGYMVMSPGADITPQAPQASTFTLGMFNISSGAGSISSANHSRASSMAEDTPLGYVPMLPMSMQHRQESYVDLDHSKGSIGGSSCSLTSGTPSMTNTGDFSHPYSSEFHLEKVSSYFVPSEDEEEHTSVSQPSLEVSQLRPARAYSLGSRPEVVRPAAIAVPRTETRPMSAKTQMHRSPSRNRKQTAPPYLSSSWSGSGCVMPPSSVAGRRLQTIQQQPQPHRHDEDDNFSLLDFSKADTADDCYVEMRVDSKRSQPINIGSQPKSSISPGSFSLSGFLSRKSSNSTPPKTAASTASATAAEPSTSSSPFSSLRKQAKKSKRHSESATPVGVFLFSPSTPSKSLVPEEQFARLNVDCGGGESVIEQRRVGTVQRPAAEQLRPRNSASESDYVPMQPSSLKRDDAAPRKAQSESVLTKDDNYGEGNYALMTAKPKVSKAPVQPKVQPQHEDYAMMEMAVGGLAPASPDPKPVPTALDIMAAIPPLGPSELDTDYALMMPGDGRTSPVVYEPDQAKCHASLEVKVKVDEGDYAVLAKDDYVVMTPAIKPPMLLSTELHLSHPPATSSVATAHSPVLAKEPLEAKTTSPRPLKPPPQLPKQPELNYASLEDTEEAQQPLFLRNLSSDSSGESDATTVCSSSTQAPLLGTQYAQIDFERTQQQQQCKKKQQQPTTAAVKKSKVQ